MSDSSVPPPKRPAVGLTLHQDKYLGFSFLRPVDWHRFDWTDGRRGVLYGPEPADNATLFAVAVQDLGTTITETDLADLKMGFVAGIGRLTQSSIESQDEWKMGQLMYLEAKYTFAEGNATRKRWVRVYYQDSRQITVSAQAASVEQYGTWLPMFYEAMMTFKIHAAPGYKQRSGRKEDASG